MKQEYADAARDFARVALGSSSSPVAIQNAHKAAEFALSAYALKKGLPLPRDHWQSASLAHRISPEFGRDFSTLLRMYLGAYRLENGKTAQKAKDLMLKLLKEIGGLAKESYIP